MRILLCFIFLSNFLFAQELKKKYLGNYEGEIPSYKIEMNQILLDVASTNIRIELLAGNQVSVEIGGNKHTGTYTLSKSSKSEITLICQFTDGYFPENLIFYKKTKTIGRKGTSPQPNSNLAKKK